MLNYPIHIDTGLLKNIKKYVPHIAKYSAIVIVTDHHVKKLYSNVLRALLPSALLLALPAGEKSKSSHNKQKIEYFLFKNQCDRNTLILALGGGVIGDLAGFTAATYMRGIDYLQIPTTLLAMVDSSVGGKTAINTPFGKNLIGAFWQPKAVIADIHCLRSLSQKEFMNGLIEALKYFLIYDKKQFLWAKKNLNAILARENTFLKKIVHHSVAIKSTIVKKDEKEKNLRMICNFGHTIAHAIEKISNYKVLHGYAVAFGILVEAKAAELLGLLDTHDFQIIQATFAELGILGHHYKKYSAEKILKAARTDKKNSKGKTRYVLLKKIGKVHATKNIFAHAVPDNIIKKAIAATF